MSNEFNTIPSQALIALFDRNDKNNVDYFFTTEAHFRQEGKTVLSQHKDGTTGAEKLKQDIEYAKSLQNCEYMLVYEFSTITAVKSKPRNIYRVNFGNTQIINIEEEKPVFNNNTNHSFEAYGGLDGFFRLHGDLSDKNFQLQVLQYEKEKAEKELAEYKSEVQTLDKENDELTEKLEKANQLVEEYSKYIPGNTKIFGIDAVKLGEIVLGKMVTRVVRNSPNVTKKVLGIDDAGFKELLNGLAGSDEPSSTTQNKQVDNVSYEEIDENLTDEQKKIKMVIDKLTEWMKQLNGLQIKKLVDIISYFDTDLNKMDNIIQFINENTSTDE